ncbi:MAG: dTDP-4-dehydrorhamnose 3,5-epimerase [Alcaligenaceae bacterium]|nr:MAG: dTDP-4-dehydrorhamnose 3,5-epimerase [Alcaligenaceae bacterium]
MQLIQTEIPDLLIIEPKVHGDRRGFFLELFQAERYVLAGIDRSFVQDNMSRSTRGVLRGLHLQNPRSQGKLVTVLHGEVLDVAVDVRLGSPTFGRHVRTLLTGENHRQFWVPRGFAHGFLVLSESADLFYKCDDFYNPENETVIAWNDPDISIEWGIEAPALSARDAAGVRLRTIAATLPEYGSI